ncbi:hypothetical protein ABT095_17350 [Kitasatospora sp. NPDC002227]|uniref:hypothetical protein n=1 Tax=Kitasatospora sp. NPDC002227 TaxID=3154773 RepID=UPI0033333468
MTMVQGSIPWILILVLTALAVYAARELYKASVEAYEIFVSIDSASGDITPGADFDQAVDNPGGERQGKATFCGGGRMAKLAKLLKFLIQFVETSFAWRHLVEAE